MPLSNLQGSARTGSWLTCRAALPATALPACVFACTGPGLCTQLRLPAQAIRILNMIKVWGKPIRVNKSSQDKRAADVGANLFIGNLDPDVDEKARQHLLLWCTLPAGLHLFCWG